MILYLARKYPPSIGGMQRFNYKLATNLSKSMDLKLVSWGGTQAILPFIIIYFFLASLYHCTTKPITCLYMSDALLSPLGIILRFLTKKPVITSVHGRDIAFDFPLYQFLVPRSLKKMNGVICVSQKLKSECIKRDIPEEIIYVIPNGITPEDFMPTERYKEHVKVIERQINCSINEKKLLLTVGRLVSKKGVNSFLLNIFPMILKENSDVIYLIVGNGPLMNEIKKIIEKKGYKDTVFLIGHVEMNDELLPNLYAMSDIFIMPNVVVKNDIEGFGIVAVESCAAGLPIVASEVDGITEAITNNENGILIPDMEYVQFANKVHELLNNDQLRIKFANRARRYIVRNFTWHKIAKHYKKRFTEVINQGV